MCLHAEESGLLEAGRNRTMGATLYTTSFPCNLCTRKSIQGGIKKIVFNHQFAMPLAKELLA